MATYTIELRTLIEEYGFRLFDDYAFYTDDKKVKAEFEKLFIETFYFHEIGCETPERFKWMLKAKLNRIMPYYKQLHQTEWMQVNKDMMNSKDLTETTTHTLTSHLSGTQEQQVSSESSSQSEASGTGTNSGTELESALENGVPQVHLESDLTRKTQSTGNNTSSSQATSESSSTTSATSQSTTSDNISNESSMTNQQQNQLEETTTFTSKGDIGIQTPAYAITEWRKIIININNLILNECQDLFMGVY